MDSISQAVLGAAIGEVLLSKKIGNKGAILGAVIATIPDLDVIILPFISPIERLSMHRGFSHSIVFSILGSIILAFILSKSQWCKEFKYSSIFIFSWLALFTHMLLDTFTAYGTNLFLPFSDRRIGFDSVNIVDPVYTLPLIVGLVYSLYFYKNSPYRSLPSSIALIVSSSYLILTLAIKTHVESIFTQELTQSNIAYDELSSQPVGMASFHWYAVANTPDGMYIGDYNFLNKKKIEFQYFEKNDSLLVGIDSSLVRTMKWFAKDKYSVSKNPDGKIHFYNVQVDMQGIKQLNDHKCPTLGYFTLDKNIDGSYTIGSGRHK